MKQNSPQATPPYGRLAGMALLVLLWAWLAFETFMLGGFNLKNILIVALTGIIIIVPLWKKYLAPILAARKQTK